MDRGSSSKVNNNQESNLLNRADGKVEEAERRLGKFDENRGLDRGRSRKMNDRIAEGQGKLEKVDEAW
jgi:hypothetical protein